VVPRETSRDDLGLLMAGMTPVSSGGAA
jgi:hypothetical protein